MVHGLALVCAAALLSPDRRGLAGVEEEESSDDEGGGSDDEEEEKDEEEQEPVEADGPVGGHTGWACPA